MPGSSPKSDDPTHGNQQLSLFHGYYDQYQYYPLVISEPTTKHVFTASLRHGTAHASLGADDDLMKVVAALRMARPDILIHIRGLRRASWHEPVECSRAATAGSACR